MNIESILRKYSARFIASFVGAFAAWLFNRYGITLGVETQGDIVAVMLGVYGIVYSSLHKYINKHVNPGDAASGALIQVEKIEDTHVRQTAE